MTINAMLTCWSRFGLFVSAKYSGDPAVGPAMVVKVGVGETVHTSLRAKVVDFVSDSQRTCAFLCRGCTGR
jgi:hypothetical protein